ncbi:MAG: NAD+ synthase [candidate division WOR-3 bacterium]
MDKEKIFKEMITKNWEEILETILKGLKKEFKKRNFENCVIGLSGGIDSSVVLSILVKTFDRKNIKPLFMPYKTTSQTSYEDVEILAKKFNIEYETVEITPQIDLYFKNEKESTDDYILKLRIGNKCARERMSVLFDRALKYKALVIGTSNRSEIIMGYGTIYGDLACSINPIGNLFKTQIFEFAKFLEIPERIILKKPSADLWVGQTDEGEMGIDYKTIDIISYLYFDKKFPVEKIESFGIEKEKILKVISNFEKNRFKRELPKILKI